MRGLDEYLFRVGDMVKCHCPGPITPSWVDGKTGTVLGLNVVSIDGVRGHKLQIDGYVTVVELEYLELLS